jgi:hypothetical protein
MLLTGLWILLPATFLGADESFITPQEYAAQLYHNPRGIGCHLCHGEQGEGRVIAEYVDKGEKKAFTAPPINRIGFDTFDRALNRRLKGMPRYFLTASERRALYWHLHPEMIDASKETNVSK